MINGEDTTGRGRCAIYYRVSDPKQVSDGFGFDWQERALPAAAVRLGFEVVAHYREPGISADQLLARPVMREVLAAMARDEFDVALAAEETRFSRGDMLDWGYILHACDATGVRLATPAGIVYDPANTETRMMMWVKGGMSEAEKLRTRRRTLNGKCEALAQNCIIFSAAPYGYLLERPTHRAADRRLVEHPERAPVVRLIYQLACAWGTARIAHHLNETGAPRPKGGAWTGSMVAKIVRNAVYRGEWGYGRHESVKSARPRKAETRKLKASQRLRPRDEWHGVVTDPEKVPPLVTNAEWEAANAATDARGEHGRGRPATRHDPGLLCSYLRCQVCGRSFRHRQTRLNKDGSCSRLYQCKARYDWKALGCEPCPVPNWPAAALEEAVWAELVAVIESPAVLGRLFAVPKGPALSGQLARYDQALGAARRAEEKVHEGWEAELYTVEEARERLGAARARIEELKRARAGLELESLALEERAKLREALLAECETLAKEARHARGGERRRILARLVSAVVLAPDGSYEVRFVYGKPRAGQVGEMGTTSTTGAQFASNPLTASLFAAPAPARRAA